MGKKIFIFIIISTFTIVSCSKSLIIKNRKEDEIIRAENSLLKKKTVMIERENSVLEIDNIFYKKKISDKNAKIEKIRANSQSFKKKMSEEVLLLNKKYDNLYQTNQILKKDSTDKIKKLTTLNRETEEFLSNKIKKLNIIIKKKHDIFNREREALKQKLSEKEYAFNRDAGEMRKKINILEKNLTDLAKEKKLLQTRVDDGQIKIKDLNAVIENYKKEIEQLININNKQVTKKKEMKKSISNIEKK